MTPQEKYWPTLAWRTLEPEGVGLQTDDFLPLQQLAHEDERVHSLLIVRSGYIVFEEYYHGWSQNHYHNVNSVTKNVTSALVGIALREKKIDTLNRSIYSFFPEIVVPGGEGNRDAILLHHLLSLTSGFELLGEADTFLERTASLEQMLNRPVLHEPGRVFSYDDVDIHLASLILARATDMSLGEFAQAHLFEPLGIWRDEQGRAQPWKHGIMQADIPHPLGVWNEQDALLWSVDRQGNQIGAFGLQLTTREMAKLGYLYLHQGLWDGQQLIPEEYVQASLRAYSTTGKGSDYGYCWYLVPFHGQSSFWAIGFGGQIIACFPALDLIFAMTARPDVGRQPAHVKVMNQGLGPVLEKLARN